MHHTTPILNNQIKSTLIFRKLAIGVSCYRQVVRDMSCCDGCKSKGITPNTASPSHPPLTLPRPLLMRPCSVERRLHRSPSETAGVWNLPDLISSLDGDRDFSRLVAAAPDAPALQPSAMAINLPSRTIERGLPALKRAVRIVAFWSHTRFAAGATKQGVVHEPF